MKLLSSKEVYRCPIFWVTEDQAQDPDGFEIRRSIVRHHGSAVMMAVDAKSRMLLVRQYRLPAGTELWELPAGRLDPGEKPLEAAKRELKEETGYRARHWKKLLTFYPSPGYVSEKMAIYLATDLVAGDAQPMEDERIHSHWFRAKEVERMILKGEIQDGKTVAGFLMWKQYHSLGA